MTGADRRGKTVVVSALMWRVGTCQSAVSLAPDSGAGADGGNALGCLETLRDGLDKVDAEHQVDAEELDLPIGNQSIAGPVIAGDCYFALELRKKFAAIRSRRDQGAIYE